MLIHIHCDVAATAPSITPTSFLGAKILLLAPFTLALGGPCPPSFKLCQEVLSDAGWFHPSICVKDLKHR